MPEPSTQDSAKNILTVELEKRPSGLGFNIVGGTDSQHIPGDTGIFITKIKPEGSAQHDGRLREGDRILSVNGISLVGVTHEQAVAVFRNCKGRVKVEVEVDAERKLLYQPAKNLFESRNTQSTKSWPSPTNSNPEPSSSANIKITRTPSSPTKAVAAASRRIFGETSVDTPRSGMSAAASATSLVDETSSVSQTSSPKRSPLPKTEEMPKPANRKQRSEGGFSRPGFYQEIAYTAVGVAVLAAVGYFVYRKFSKK